MTQIVDVHFPDLKRELLHEALTTFFQDPRDAWPEEKAATSEIARLDQAVGRRRDTSRAAAQRRCQETDPRRCTVRCSKNEQDVHLFEQLVFLKPPDAR